MLYFLLGFLSATTAAAAVIVVAAFISIKRK